MGVLLNHSVLTANRAWTRTARPVSSNCCVPMMRVPVNSESFGRERFWVMALARALAIAAPRRARMHRVTTLRGVGEQEPAEATAPPTRRDYLVVAWPP